MEKGAPVLFQVRLKMASGSISEIDTTVVRNQTEGMIYKPDQLKEASPAMNVIPDSSHRNTRDEMTRLALLYPAGLKVGSFVKVDAQFADDAYRFENGQIMAGPNAPSCPAARISESNGYRRSPGLWQRSRLSMRNKASYGCA